MWRCTTSSPMAGRCRSWSGRSSPGIAPPSAWRLPTLPALPLQFADVAAWRARPGGRRHLRRPAGLLARSAWPMPTRRWPCRRTGCAPACRRGEGGRIGVTLPPALAESIRAAAQLHGTTPFVVLLAGFRRAARPLCLQQHRPHRHSRLRPQPDGNRGADRLLHQHAGGRYRPAPGGSRPCPAGAGAGEGAAEAQANGDIPFVRTRRRAAAGTRTHADAVLPGHVQPAAAGRGHARRPAGRWRSLDWREVASPPSTTCPCRRGLQGEAVSADAGLRHRHLRRVDG